MAKENETQQTVLIADAGYEAAAAELAAEYPDLNLLCADEAGDVQALATGAVAGLIAQTATVDAALLEAVPGLRAVLKLGAQLHQYRCRCGEGARFAVRLRAAQGTQLRG